MALSQKEVCILLWTGPSNPMALPRSANAHAPLLPRFQADIQMMLAAQCHLGTKCVARAETRGPPAVGGSAGSRLAPFCFSARVLGGMLRAEVHFGAISDGSAALCSPPVRNCDFQMERYTWRRRTNDGAHGMSFIAVGKYKLTRFFLLQASTSSTLPRPGTS